MIIMTKDTVLFINIFGEKMLTIYSVCFFLGLIPFTKPSR